MELELENSQVIQARARAGALDILPKLAELSNEERELILTEMAFSTNTSITAKELNWEINSQMNEGVVGIHIAVGDGLTGAHIDFICPGVHPIDTDKKPVQ